MQKIRVYGRLSKLLKAREFLAEVSSAAEAVRFLLANWPHLEQHMISQRYRVTVGGYAISEEELQHPIGEQEIRIIPVIGGAGATGRILAGVALIAGAFFTGGATIGLLGLAAPVALSTVLGGIGVSLVLGGVSQLLSPVPTIPTEQSDPRASYSFSGVQNTSRQGLPIPLIYGEMICGSIVVSAGVDTVQVAA